MDDPFRGTAGVFQKDRATPDARSERRRVSREDAEKACGRKIEAPNWPYHRPMDPTLGRSRSPRHQQAAKLSAPVVG